MTVTGTTRTCSRGRDMSAIGATVDVICSERVFRLLTQTGHSASPQLSASFPVAITTWSKPAGVLIAEKLAGPRASVA
jgi:hypothetical protein